MTARRLFHLLLRLYPRTFREEYGREMTALHLRRLERADGVAGRTRVWTRATLDVVRTAALERLDGGTRGGGLAEGRNGGEMMGGLWQDFRHAGRRLLRSPVFTVAAVAMLAVGIGANATVFALVDTLLLRPAPYDDPGEVVTILQHSDDGEPSSTSFPAYRDMAELDGVFAAVAATSPDGASLETADGSRPVSVEYATSSYVGVTGLPPSRGRWFSPEHDVPGAEPVAVVSHRTWTGELGSDPGVLGRTIRLNGQPVRIVGVGPEGFNGAGGMLSVDYWLSISATPVGGPWRVANLDRREDHWYVVEARLAPGVGPAEASAAMDRLAARLAEAYPELNRGRDITVFAHDELRIHPEVDGHLAPLGAGLFAVAGLVLLLACSNLANLLLVRGVSRSSEMAVRRALGASRARVGRIFLVEAVLLALLGGAAGLLLARWAIGLLTAVPVPVPGGASLDVTLDGRVLVFGLVVALLTAGFFGLAPALRAFRSDLAGAMREEGRTARAGRGGRLLRNALVAVQVAVSVVLVVGAGLAARSLAEAGRIDPGVDVDRVALVGTDLRQGGIGGEEAAAVVDRILRRVRALPGVRAAAVTSRLPVEAGGTTTTVVEGWEPASGTGSVELDYALVSDGYFETMGIPLLRGRTFGPDDRPDAPRAVVVNEAMAERFWGGDAVGRRVRPQGAPDDWRTVVGVVADAAVDDVREPPTPMMFYSTSQSGANAFTVVVRTDGDPDGLVAPLRAGLREVRSSLPVTRSGTLREHLGRALAGSRTAATVLGAFSLLALLLASLGIYAIVSFTVARRTAEMGIRMALGAARESLVGSVVREAMVVVLLGAAAGLGLALLGARAAEGLLFGVPPHDPATLTGSALLLVAVALLASWIPARRAAGADPVEVLRTS